MEAENRIAAVHMVNKVRMVVNTGTTMITEADAHKDKVDIANSHMATFPTEAGDSRVHHMTTGHNMEIPMEIPEASVLITITTAAWEIIWATGVIPAENASAVTHGDHHMEMMICAEALQWEIIIPAKEVVHKEDMEIIMTAEVMPADHQILIMTIIIMEAIGAVLLTEEVAIVDQIREEVVAHVVPVLP